MPYRIETFYPTFRIAYLNISRPVESSQELSIVAEL
jgi:hypothetical protein